MQTSLFHRWWQCCTWCALLITLAWAAGGCGPAHSNRTLIVAVDRSGSTDSFRANQLDQVDSVQTAGIADSCPVELWSFDATPSCLWGPHVPDSSHALDVVKEKELRPNGELASRHVTRPALLLQALNQHIRLNKLAQPNVLILTDGDSEVSSDTRRFFAEAATLAKVPGVRVAVIGISTENRKVWENAFTSALGNRFQMAGQSEADNVLNSILQ